jgi:hypothetical protein
MHKREGYIPVVGDYRIWYQIVGGGADHENTPLVHEGLNKSVVYRWNTSLSVSSDVKDSFDHN